MADLPHELAGVVCTHGNFDLCWVGGVGVPAVPAQPADLLGPCNHVAQVEDHMLGHAALAQPQVLGVDVQQVVCRTAFGL